MADHRIRQMLADALGTFLYSTGQGLAAQSQVPYNRAKSAAISAGFLAPMQLQAMRKQQQQDEEDRQLKMQQIRQLMLQGQQQLALEKLKNLQENPPMGSVTYGEQPPVTGTPETGLTVPDLPETYGNLPPFQFPTDLNGGTTPIPILSQRQKDAAARDRLQQELAIKQKFAPPPPAPRIDPLSTEGQAAQIAIDKARNALRPPESPYINIPGIGLFNKDTKQIEKGTAPEPKADNEPLVAIVKDGKPILVPRSQAIGQTPASSREQGRPVPAGQADDMADLDNSLSELSTLKGTIPKGTTGTVAKVGASLPNAITDLTGWGTDAKKKQAVIDRVKQIIGKALEGGVLRKEDEAKYEKILPGIADTYEVAKTKIDGLEKAIQKKRQSKLDALDDAGYDVSRFRARTSVAPIEQFSPSTKQYRYSLDGGKTWNSGRLPNQ